MSEIIKGGCYMKHTMSGAAGDLLIEFEADMVSKIVETQMKRFDSSLFTDFVVSYLPEQHGIVAYMDDNAKGNQWMTPDTEFKLFANFSGIRLRAEVVVLFKQGHASCSPRIAVILDTKGCEQQRLF